MRDPNSVVKTYELDSPPVVIKMDEIPDYNLYDFDLADEKSFKKYMKAIEKSVRSSFEYKQMVSYLREYGHESVCFLSECK